MKLKVFSAVATTFAFMARHALDILHIIWLPVLLQIAGLVLLLPGYLTTTAMMGADPPADMQEVWARLGPIIAQPLLFLLVVIATTVIMYAGLTRLVLRGEKPGQPFLLRWGADEWRILGGWGLLLLISIGLWIGAVACMWLGGALIAMGPGPGGVISVIGVIAVVLVGIWITTRLSLLVPATIARSKIGIEPSWEASEENFWNLFGLWLIWAVLAMLVQFVLTRFLTPPGYLEALQSVGFGSPDAMREAMRKANAALAESYDLSDMGNLTRLVASGLLSIAGSLIMAIAGAVAWRAMTDTPSEAKP